MRSLRDVGDDGRRAVQRVRAGLLAALVLSLAAGAHVLAGDALPAPALLVALAAVTLAATTVVGRRRLRRRTLVPALVAGQWALHHALAVLAAPLPAADAAPVGGVHLHGAAVLPAVGEVGPDVVAPSAAMTLAHALAAAVTALVAVSADRAWAAALTWLDRLVPALAVALRPLVPAGAPRARRTRRTRVVVPAAVVLSTRPRRGPPAALLAA
ncbi:hypothetical protein EDC03_0827 [Pseudokineococcus lusitanus]|uniref:Uncharacterized protein n=1 Tax=Pseudokineococcus lusitanus TaxID=763993 RepID=A0A3N1HQD4_9ACTN|nr:hypothetical protein EDC03_0827 [Pseudokineococcus lusitanus]